MKAKNVFILLLMLIVAAGLMAVSYFGIGKVKATSTNSQQTIELATNADGEYETEVQTDEQGETLTEPVTEAVTDEAGETVTDENGDAVTEEVTDESGNVVTEPVYSYVISNGENAEPTTYDYGYGSVKAIKQGLDLKGGVYIVYQASKEAPTEEEMAAAVSMIQQRVTYKGWYEAEVSQEGDNRIRVEIPGVEDAATAVDEIGSTAHLTFQDEDGNVLVDGSNVKNAGKAYQNNQVVVTLEFDDEGTEAFAGATTYCIGKRLSIYMDDQLLSAPTVQSAITDGSAVITGDFTADEAEELAAKIRAGSLPFNLEVIDYNEIGATLGANSLSTSIKAGLIGIALVFLFMLIVYRVEGLAADIALVIYMGLNLTIISLLGLTLTLPGVAGIILGVGMAVDANVIIFERIKDELNLGRPLKGAIKNGFSRALTAIIDGNVTTLVACCVLMWLGTGTIKGFAQTLMLSIIISMITAVFITRIIVNALVGLGLSNPKLYGAKNK
jgi:protein-export SecD/SecF family membrane protein